MRDSMTNNENTPRKRSRTIGFHPIRTIIFLGLLVLILLYFIMLFGLGSGGGKTFPGSSDSISTQPKTDREQIGDPDGSVTDENDQAALSGTEKPVVRRELTISFIPSETDPDTAVESFCQLQWLNVQTGSPVSQNIVAENKADFEFALEKAIRAWRTSLNSQTMVNIPVVAIRMTPFPGEGTFQKINELVKSVDSRINILRLETTPTRTP